MWTWTAVAGLFAVLAVFHAISILIDPARSPYARALSLLQFCMAGFWFTGFVMLLRGTLVLSPEFGNVMGQGSAGWLGLAVLIIGTGICAGLAWHAARTAADLPSELPLILMAGLAAGILSACRLPVLNLNVVQQARAHVYSYDFWWPPMLIWLCWCLAESARSVFKIGGRLFSFCTLSILVTGLGLVAIHREPLTDPLSRELWIASLVIAFPASLTLAWIEALLPLKQTLRRSFFAVTTPIFLCLGLLLAHLSLGRHSPFKILAAHTPDVSAWTILVVWLSLLLIPLGWGTIGKMSPAGENGAFRRPVISESQIRRGIFVLAVAGMLLSLEELFYSTRFEPPVSLLAFMLFWLLSVEASEGFILRYLSQTLKAGERTLWSSPIMSFPKQLAAKLGLLLFGSKDNAQERSGASAVASVLLKTLIGLVVLIALCEIPNAGRTIIQPFKVYVDFSQSKNSRVKPAEIGQCFTDCLVKSLGRLRRELRPDVIRAMSPGRAKSGSVFELVASGETGADIGAVLAKSPDLEFLGAKIPLGIIAPPIQHPMRSLLGVRVLTGSLHVDKSGYTVLAGSNGGEPWRAQSAHDGRPGSSSGGGGAGVPGPVPEPPAPEAFLELADQLAFRILSTDPTLSPGMLTHSWEAFQAFAEGLKAWKRFEARKDFDALSAAGWQFRQATLLDPGFALAHYRLGLALQGNGQPFAAAKAFRKSIEINPADMPSRIALAETLYDPHAYHFSVPMPCRESSRKSAVNDKCRKEAWELWDQMAQIATTDISDDDFAAASFGLCRHVYGNGADSDEKFPLAYFYCKRSAVAYARVASRKSDDLTRRSNEAAVLNQLGVILDSGLTRGTHGDPKKHRTTWHCVDGPVTEEDMMAPASPAARRYYDGALALNPFNAVIRCNAAHNAYALGDPRPMKALEAGAEGHISLADSLYEDGSYQRALEEYELALDSDPSNWEALNGYAYTFWSLQYNRAPGEMPEGIEKIAHKAEELARRAIALQYDQAGNTDKAQLLSTLGEVLLGQARPHEAIEHLEKALMCSGEHTVYNEIRWDLAQAYICACSNDRDKQEQGAVPQTIQDGRKKAGELLKHIRESEMYRESKPFTYREDLLDPARTKNVCRRRNGSPEYPVERNPVQSGPLYVLREGRPEYEPHHISSWMGVLCDATARDGRPVNYTVREGRAEGLQLHLWGGGVDRRIWVGEPRANIMLPMEPRDTHDYFFAQLEDPRGEPVSEVYPVSTYANEKDGSAEKNLIKLVFKQVR